MHQQDSGIGFETVGGGQIQQPANGAPFIDGIGDQTFVERHEANAFLDRLVRIAVVRVVGCDDFDIGVHNAFRQVKGPQRFIGQFAHTPGLDLGLAVVCNADYPCSDAERLEPCDEAGLSAAGTGCVDQIVKALTGL